MIKAEDNAAKEQYFEPVVMVAEVNNDRDVGSGGPTKFRGLRQVMIKTAIVAK
jgi:hypothetical protein